MQGERKALEDSIREKQNAFGQEWRAYQTRYTERKKQLDLKKKMEQKSRDLERAGKPVASVTPPAAAAPELAPAETAPTPTAVTNEDPMAEFEKIPSGPGVPLAPKKGP